MPSHLEHPESSSEEVIREKAFSGITDPLECSGIDVLESPSKCLTGFSFLRVNCENPKSLAYLSKKNSVGSELLKNFGKITGLSSIAHLITGVWVKRSEQTALAEGRIRPSPKILIQNTYGRVRGHGRQEAEDEPEKHPGSQPKNAKLAGGFTLLTQSPQTSLAGSSRWFGGGWSKCLQD